MFVASSASPFIFSNVSSKQYNQGRTDLEKSWEKGGGGGGAWSLDFSTFIMEN